MQVHYPDWVPTIMQSPHPAILSDGRMLNFSRTFPFGGSHLWVQHRTSLKRKEVSFAPLRSPTFGFGTARKRMLSPNLVMAVLDGLG